jgi:hypothetical protein
VAKLLHTTENLVHQPNSFEAENAIEDLKIYKLSGIIQVVAETVETEVKHNSP